MATSELEKQARQSLQARNAQLQAMVQESTAVAAEAIRDKDKLALEQNKRLEAHKMVLAQMGKGRQIGIDLGGGLIAFASTELVNWGIRALGSWSKDGWLARNNDFLQSLPHVAIGTLIYIAEMVTRPPADKRLPSRSRQVLSEAGKIFSTLGWFNLARAVRFRMSNSKSLTEDNAALRAELAALKAAAGQGG